MRIAILSRNRALYTTRRLVQTARALGHTPVVLDPLELFMMVGKQPWLFHRESTRKLGRVHAVIPRIGAGLTEYALTVVRQFEAMGVPVVNSAGGIGLVRDKMRCLQVLSRHGIQIPRTAMIRHPRQLGLALDKVGGPPVVLKLIQGSQGIGVILLETVEAVESVLDTLWSLGQTILLQEFVAESRGRDVRALVVGGDVLVGMRRQARIGEFRSNIHRGGTGTLLELPADYRETAIRAAAIAGLDLAGVDILESKDGPKVMEINASPGFQGIETATGIDVAAAIVRCGEDKAGRGKAGGDAA